MPGSTPIRRGGIGPLMALLAVLASLAAAAGAQAAPVPGQVQTFTYGSGLTAHSYLVYTPRGYVPGHPLPLLVMLHGCETTAVQQMEANLYNPLADAKGFVVVYPEVDALEMAQPGPLAKCWQFFDPQDWLRGQNDDAAVAAITEAVMSGWGIDPQRVYLMGMSAGSFLTADMAAEYPDLYAAVGENAGGAYADPSCLVSPDLSLLSASTSATLAFSEMGARARVVPKIVIGGDADAGVPPACADKSLEQSLRTDNLVIDGDQTAPISLTPASVTSGQVPGGRSYTVSTYDDQYGCVIGQRWLVHGMNHFWSGGSTDPALASFTDPQGPSAAAASWAFFAPLRLVDGGSPCAAPAAAAAPTASAAPVAAACHWVRTIVMRFASLPREVRVLVGGRGTPAHRSGRTLRISLAGRGSGPVRIEVLAGRRVLREAVIHPCA